MYLHKVSIRNIRSIRDFAIRFAPDSCAGWHVLLGDNGSGKSTVIRSIALGLVGPDEAAALRQNWNDWLQPERLSGKISLDVVPDDKLDTQSSAIGKHGKIVSVEITIRRKVDSSPQGVGGVSARGQRFLWVDGTGWFSASYGPFRRFSGGDSAHSQLFKNCPRLAPHLSAFGEDVALTECLGWLQTLHFKKLEGSKREGILLENLKAFLNDELLPHGTKLEDVTSDGVFFTDGNGRRVSVMLLSDGYRSILSMTFELIRQMERVYGASQVFKSIREGEMVIDLPGVVLVDEIDAHLHPTWQRRIGYWFLKYFPKVQFIVTTHSPLVCHAAEQGSVWKLPAPGSDEKVRQVEGDELKKVLYGDLVEAYDTELFGIPTTRSESAREMQSKLAQLNVKSRRAKLSASESRELKQLRATLPTIATEAGGE